MTKEILIDPDTFRAALSDHLASRTVLNSVFFSITEHSIHFVIDSGNVVLGDYVTLMLEGASVNPQRPEAILLTGLIKAAINRSQS